MDKKTLLKEIYKILKSLSKKDLISLFTYIKTIYID